jgi:predicted amidohydrolase YtcJ
MAIRGDRIQAAGKEDEILKLKGPQTEVINLSGHFAMPGFNDAHVHLAEAGFQRLTVNLASVKSLTESATAFGLEWKLPSQVNGSSAEVGTTRCGR